MATAAPSLYAVVGVVDGDTLKVRVGGRTERVRLIGVDTPESVKPGTPVQCYAKQATSRMQSLVQSRSVRLVRDPSQADRDRYGRLLRYVDLADGRSVARLLIAGGFGRELTYAGPYAEEAANRAAEATAKATNAGLWGACASFGAPLAPAPAATAASSGSGSCLIKGNISRSGERIYHVPLGRYYDSTVITPSKGERWFCTEAQAVAAGWRRSKV